MVSITKGDDMKKILVLAFVFAVGCASYVAPDYPASKIHQIPGKSKAQIFNAATSWMASNVGPINYKDAAEGKIVADGKASAFDGFDRPFSYLLSVYVKDGRIMTEYNNVKVQPAYNAYIKTYVDKKVDEIINNLVVHLNGGKSSW
jgi:hypothetical protein